MDEETKAYLMQEIPKGEGLLKEYGQRTVEAKKVIIPVLTRMYWLLNEELAKIAHSLGYAKNQSEWPDSKPLAYLAREMPGIETTHWYQMQLGEIILPSGHPWVRIITYWPTEPPSASANLSESP